MVKGRQHGSGHHGRPMQLLDAKQFREPSILGNLIVIDECNQPVLTNECLRDVEGAITRRCYAPLRLHGQLNAKAGLLVTRCTTSAGPRSAGSLLTTTATNS